MNLPEDPQNQSLDPLNPEEKRLILGQLYELKACRQEKAAQADFIGKESAQDEREKAISKRELDLEKQATKLAQDERDLALEKAKFYESLYRGITKGPGIGCRLARIITLGIVRCN